MATMVVVRTRPDPRRPHPAAHEHRDRGLDRISATTAWTAAGALALTGGFTALAARGFTGHAGASTPATRSTTTMTPPAAAVTTPTTAPGTDDSSSDDRSATTPSTAPATTPQTHAPQTTPQTTPDTSPWQDTVPQWQPPVSQSGGS
jgi:hypothetical protein